MKKECASDSWPASPTSRFSPRAATMAAKAKTPTCSQKASRKNGATSPTATTARRARSPGRGVPRQADGPNHGRPASASSGVSDTGCLRRPEQAGGADEEDTDHHDVGHDRAEALSEE